MNTDNPNEQESQRDYPRYSGSNFGVQLTPHSTAVLVLGILSIVFCCVFISIVFAIIALVLAAESEKKYRLQPAMYTESSYKNLKAGKVCAIIGLCLSIFTILSWITWFLAFGTFIFNQTTIESPPW